MQKRRCGRARRGSQFHLQNLVNERPGDLNALILARSASLRAYAAAPPRWVSPLAADDYCEYRDELFLHVVGLGRLEDDLARFWPPGGPCWDALATVAGRDGSQGVVLLEAKSHVGEMRPASCGAGSARSLGMIRASLREVREALGVADDADWTRDTYYQYANRLAHLCFLALREDVPTWLVFLYFLRDAEQGGPGSEAEWRPEIEAVKRRLGLPERHGLLDERVVEAFAPILKQPG